MQEKSSIKENILQYIDYKGISKYKFYKESGITRGVLDQPNGMSEENTTRFLDYANEVNPTWLLTGKGEMLLSEEKNAITPSSNGEGVPLIPLEAFAGFGNGAVQVMDYEAQRYVVPEFTEMHVDFMIRIKGSSMYPKYNSGDIVACKKLALNDVFFQWNKVYVLDTDQGAIIKRIKPGSDEEHITLKSDNESYDPFELHTSRINAIALVVGVIRFE